MKENRKMLGNALLILTAMIWGTAFVFQRVGMESIEPITFNASRMALAAVAVGAVSALPSQARKRKLENDIRKAEEKIAALEDRDREIDELLSREEVFTDMSRLLKLNQEKEQIQADLLEWMDIWEKLSME